MDYTSQILAAVKAFTILEATGVAFGLLYIYLAAKENIWCWPAGLVSVIIYVFICFEAKLYAEVGLQFYYLGASLYGWYHWNRQADQEALPISTLTIKQHALFIGIGTIVTIVLGYLLSEHTDASIPYIDSFTTIFSLLTTILVTRKVLENWLYWIIVDSVGAYQYFYKELYLTSFLFALYVIIVVFGYIKWRKIYRQKYA
jgi:nicotinamide mononucleotide transporter